MKTEYKILFGNRIGDLGALKILKIKSLSNIICYAVQFCTVVFAVLLLFFDEISLLYFFIPLFLISCCNILAYLYYFKLSKYAYRINKYEQKKGSTAIYDSLFHLLKRITAVIINSILVNFFLTISICGIIVYALFSIGADILSFLRLFVIILVTIDIILNNLFEFRVIALEKEFKQRNNTDIDKVYYEQCKTLPQKMQNVKKINKLLMFLLNIFYGLPKAKKLFKLSVNRSALKKLKPPYLVIANHSSPADFRIVAPSLFPHACYYIAAYNQFVGHPKLMQSIGLIPKRQFDYSLTVIKDSKNIFKQKNILTLFPEGKVSSDGKAGIIRPSLAKYIKYCCVPVVFMHSFGAYVTKPKWANRIRKFNIKVEHKLLLTADDVNKKTSEEIFDFVKNAFDQVDDLAYQKDNNLQLMDENRAEGLHNILYACPNCGAQFKTESEKTILTCAACQKKWHLTPLNELNSQEGITEFDKITDWYNWQRESVQKEIDQKKYAFFSRCMLMYLADFKGWHSLGGGSILQNPKGFVFVGDDGRNIEFDTSSVYTLPYDFEYGIYLNDTRFTYRVVLPNPQTATKVNFAVEYYYAISHTDE